MGAYISASLLWKHGTSLHIPVMPVLCEQVHMVVGRANMWANIQRAAAPNASTWQLDEKSAWLAFFDGETLAARHLGTLQPPLRCACAEHINSIIESFTSKMFSASQ